MTRLFALSALIPALMTSTALAADVLAEPVVVEEAPAFTLTGTAGVIVFDMPDFDTGVFDITDDSLAWGGLIGLSGSGAISNQGDWDVILGFNVFGAFAGGSTTTNYSGGPGTVYISGMSLPTGGNAISTDATLAAGNDVAVDTDALDGAITTADGVNTGAGFAAPTGPGPGFIVGGASVTSAAGGDTVFGAIADSGGGIVVVSGELDDAISTEVSRNIFYGGADVTLGLGGEIGDGTSGQVYIGPSYRGLFQENTTTTTVNLPETTPVTLPNFSISTIDDIDSHYFGGVLGGNVAFAAGEGMVFTLGLEGGVYSVHASWTGHDSYETSGGSFPDPDGAGPFLPGDQATLTVDGPESEFEFDDEIAFAVRGNAAVSWAIGNNQAFSLGGSVEYLSAVATVDHAGQTVVDDGDPIGAWPGTNTAPTQNFRWDSIVNFAITASLTGQF